MLTPLEPGTLFGLVQAGYAIEFIFDIGVRSINGVRNQTDIGLLQQTGDPAFSNLLQALQEIQRAEAVGIRRQKTEHGLETVMFFPAEMAGPAIQSDIKLVRDLLGLAPDVHEFRLVFGLLPKDDHEIAILSRSMLEIMFELAAEVDIPQAHLADGRTMKITRQDGDERLLRIRSQPGPPEDAFVAVPYQNHWFWIDNKDVATKRVLASMMMLFSLAETSSPAQMPVITVGAGQ